MNRTKVHIIFSFNTFNTKFCKKSCILLKKLSKNIKNVVPLQQKSKVSWPSG